MMRWEEMIVYMSMGNGEFEDYRVRRRRGVMKEVEVLGRW
jgi:hypothetical protein